MHFPDAIHRFRGYLMTDSSLNCSTSSGTITQSGAFVRLTKALAEPVQPETAFQAFDTVCAGLFGHKLLTILAWQAGSDEAERVYTSLPNEYPLAARKRMGPTEWGSLVLKGAQPWFGRNADDMRWAFPDHALIASLGCASCLNTPIRWKGGVLGAVSVLDSEGAYTESSLEILQGLSSLLIAPLLDLRMTGAGSSAFVR
jgi:GAF domain-containing protein